MQQVSGVVVVGESVITDPQSLDIATAVVNETLGSWGGRVVKLPFVMCDWIKKILQRCCIVALRVLGIDVDEKDRKIQDLESAVSLLNKKQSELEANPQKDEEQDLVVCLQASENATRYEEIMDDLEERNATLEKRAAVADELLAQANEEIRRLSSGPVNKVRQFVRKASAL